MLLDLRGSAYNTKSFVRLKPPTLFLKYHFTVATTSKRILFIGPTVLIKCRCKFAFHFIQLLKSFSMLQHRKQHFFVCDKNRSLIGTCS